MAQKSQRLMVAATPEERSLDELAASRGELVGSVVKAIEFAVAQMNRTPDEARELFRSTIITDPDAIQADQVSWHDLAAYGEANPDGVSALWQRLKDEAANDLFTGARVGKALERPLVARPLDRAAFMVILGGLRTSLEPRDALEMLLIQQMASAFEMHLRWQRILVRRMEEETWQAERDKRRVVDNMTPRQRERYEDNHGWLPPRLAETEALEQAATLADRSQRQFLRLMKAFRDNRRMFNALIVAGGQVNIGEQQVNVSAAGTGAHVKTRRHGASSSNRTSQSSGLQGSESLKAPDVEDT